MKICLKFIVIVWISVCLLFDTFDFFLLRLALVQVIFIANQWETKRMVITS